MEFGTDTFVATNSLLQKTSDGPSNVTLNMRTLYFKTSLVSVAIFKAINSDPKLKVSTVFWCLMNHKIWALLVYMMIPVCEGQISKFTAWYAYAYKMTFTDFNPGLGVKKLR